MYRGYFRDIRNVDINSGNGVIYRVDIIPSGTENYVKEIKFAGDSPVVIKQNSDGLFSEIKPMSATVNIMTTELIPDIYSKGIQDVEVKIYQGDQIIFDGYATPYIYNQDYAYQINSIEVEAVSKLSVLKDIPYRTINDTEEIVSLDMLIMHLLTLAGYSDPVFYTTNDKVCTGEPINTQGKEFFKYLKISESNFFDDDSDKTPWSCEDVLKEICRYLCVTAFDVNGEVYFVDNQYVANSNDVRRFTRYYFNNSGNIAYQQWADQTRKPEIEKSDYASNDANVSYDDIYNKIEVNVNTYDIEKLTVDPLDIENQTWCGKTDGSLSGSGEVNWIVHDRKTTETTYKQYTIFSKAADESNWKHRYFRISTGVELDNTRTNPWHDSSALSLSDYTSGENGRINTTCALFERCTKYNAASAKPAELSWDNYIAFYCFNDLVNRGRGSGLTGKLTRGTIGYYEKPVLTYTSPDAIRYSPTSGTSWITFKGDLYYQTHHEQKKKATLNIVGSDFYTMSPVDGVTDHDAFQYTHKFEPSGLFNDYTVTFPSRSKGNSNYGKGWALLKCRLKIGNKYWNGSVWTPTESDFYINYNNGAKNGDNETVGCLQWQKVAPNTDFTNGVGDVWAIPITRDDDVQGRLEFTLYTPNQLKPFWENGVGYGDADWIPWHQTFPVIFMKDMELNYVYTDTKVWFLRDDKDRADIVYTHTVDTNYERMYDDDIECKINTYAKDYPISKSFVMQQNYLLNNNCVFLSTLKNLYSGTIEKPENLIIEKMLDHYMDKKLIYEATLHNNGFLKMIFPYSISALPGHTFVIDSYEIDLKNATNTVKFIEW